MLKVKYFACICHRDYYGVDEFPVDQMMVRSAEGKRRNLYFVSKSIRQLVEQNSERIKVTLISTCRYLFIF